MCQLGHAWIWRGFDRIPGDIGLFNRCRFSFTGLCYQVSSINFKITIHSNVSSKYIIIKITIPGEIKILFRIARSRGNFLPVGDILDSDGFIIFRGNQSFSSIFNITFRVDTTYKLVIINIACHGKIRQRYFIAPSPGNFLPVGDVIGSDGFKLMPSGSQQFVFPISCKLALRGNVLLKCRLIKPAAHGKRSKRFFIAWSFGNFLPVGDIAGSGEFKLMPSGSHQLGFPISCNLALRGSVLLQH
ncbi:hypothetical protein CIC12_32125 [Burkholderia sp. SG-MS1]|nr:hypothetical protein [Paraburkholderia sp. SG-MS1]